VDRRVPSSGRDVPCLANADTESLRCQLAEARKNLRLIEEPKSQYVQETDVPLQLIKDERRLLERIEQLEQAIGSKSE
jgi:hypothetical protein